MPIEFTEIERKFLIDSFPTGLPLRKSYEIHQAYLSIDPEVRIRSKCSTGPGLKGTEYFITVKSGEGLVRQEVDIRITMEHFFALAKMVKKPFIMKDYRKYQLPNGLALECSCVDKGHDTEFMYAEVEFPNVETAEAFEPLACFTVEVTDDPSYKMKNFWKRTRLEDNDAK